MFGRYENGPDNNGQDSLKEKQRTNHRSALNKINHHECEERCLPFDQEEQALFHQPASQAESRNTMAATQVMPEVMPMCFKFVKFKQQFKVHELLEY